MCSGLYLLILYSSISAHSLSLLVTITFVYYVSESVSILYVPSFVLFFRFHMQMISCILSFSDLLHLVWYPLGPLMLLQTEIFHSLLGLSIYNLGASQVAQRWRICQCRRCKRPGFNPRVGKIPWRRKWQPTPVFLPGDSHGQRGLAGCSPWGSKESDTTEYACTNAI